MIRRQFIKTAGLTTGSLFGASLLKVGELLAMPNDDNHLQIAADFDFNSILIDISGYAELNDVKNKLDDGQLYYWRQTVVTGGSQTLVYRGRLLGEQVLDVVQVYNIEFVPFAQEIKDEPVEPLEKTLICHIPAGNPNRAKTLEIKSSNADGHLNHGDTLGPCPVDPPAAKGDAIIEDSTGQPDLTFELGQNYPNPVSDLTTVPLTLPESAHTRITVYNMLGQRLETLIDGELAAGRHQLLWSRTDRPPGTYLLVVEAGALRASRRIIVTK